MQRANHIRLQGSEFLFFAHLCFRETLGQMGFSYNLLATSLANISPLFALLTVVLLLAVLVSLVLVRFKQSLLVGYLISGVLIGNFGLLWLTGLDKGDPVISNFAEIGVVLLMFTLAVCRT